jgi:hypothetical protein
MALRDALHGFRGRVLAEELLTPGTQAVVPTIPTFKTSITTQTLDDSGKRVVLGWRWFLGHGGSHRTWQSSATGAAENVSAGASRPGAVGQPPSHGGGRRHVAFPDRRGPLFPSRSVTIPRRRPSSILEKPQTRLSDRPVPAAGTSSSPYRWEAAAPGLVHDRTCRHLGAEAYEASKRSAGGAGS